MAPLRGLGFRHLAIWFSGDPHSAYAADNALQTAQLQFFFPDAVLANETYYECGSFISGSSTIGSGNMFNHALFATPYSKSAGTDSTLEIDIQFS